MGGGKKKKKDNVDKKFKDEVRQLDDAIDYSSEFLVEAGEDLNELLAEKENLEDITSRLDAVRQQEYDAWFGDAVEATEEGKLSDDEREKMLSYLEKHANHWSVVKRVGDNSGEATATMSEDMLKQYLTRAYKHSSDFGDEIKSIIQESGRFKWDRQYDHYNKRVEQSLEALKALYDGQHQAYKAGVEEYRDGMVDLAKKYQNIQALQKDETFGVDMGSKWGSGVDDRSWLNGTAMRFQQQRRDGREHVHVRHQGKNWYVPKEEYEHWKTGWDTSFYDKQDHSRYSNMSLDDLEAATAGLYEGNYFKFTQDHDWNRDIQSADMFKWE